MPSPTPKRADAARNRDTILAVARAAFADGENDVSMAEIARRAGVGMATVYRNFPGRRELLEALHKDEVDAVCAAAATIDGPTPGARFDAWLRRLFVFITTKRPVGNELLRDTGGDASYFGESRARVVAAGQPLFDAARRSGELRDDLTFPQIMDMITAISVIHGSSDYLEPILQATLDGLRRGAPGRDDQR